MNEHDRRQHAAGIGGQDRARSDRLVFVEREQRPRGVYHRREFVAAGNGNPW